MDPLRMINLAHLNHFVPADDAVLVNIVKSEAPINLLLQGSLAEGGEELHEVPEGDPTGPVPDKDRRCDASYYSLTYSVDWLSGYHVYK